MSDIHLHVHLPDSVAGEIMKQLKRHELLLGRIIMQQAEQTALELVKAQLVKVEAEYQAEKDENATKQAEATAKIAELQLLIADRVEPEVAQALLDEIQALVNQIDAKRADAPPTEENPAPVTE